ncbi:hypothetical protein ACFQV8_39630 [Pseudonocardia benzenivorans]
MSDTRSRSSTMITAAPVADPVVGGDAAKSTRCRLSARSSCTSDSSRASRAVKGTSPAPR